MSLETKRKAILMSQLSKDVKNAELLKLVDGYLDTVPEVFWHAPASSSGQWHPEFDLGDGGTFRHKLVALEFGRELCRFYDATSEESDSALCAIAIHDTYKGGPGPEWTETVKDHGDQASRAWRDFCLEQKLSGPIVNSCIEISVAVAQHMGIWASTRFEDKHMGKVSKIVAMADYVSTRNILNYGAINAMLNTLGANDTEE